MNRPVILAVGGPLQGQHFSVDSQGVRIGRDPANEVVIPTPDVSRHHARVILHNGALWVQDAGSRNGVYVNGNRVSGHTQVAPGDRVSVGNSEFQVQLAGEDTDGSVSVNMDAVRPQGKPAKNKKKSQRTRADRQSGEGTRKRWPLVVAAVALVGLLGLVFLVGLRGKDTEDPNLAEMRKAIEPAPFSLGTLKAEQESKKVEATAEAQPSSGTCDSRRTWTTSRDVCGKRWWATR